MNPEKLRILVTGGSGLVGSKFVELAKEQFEITTAGRTISKLTINLCNRDEIELLFKNNQFDAVVNFAAFTKVEEAQKQSNDRLGEVYILNSQVPLWIAKLCRESDTYFYHISTDYVFNGENGPYHEDDTPKPINQWYAATKYQGELNTVEGMGGKNLWSITRISFPFSCRYNRKSDIARTVVERLRSGQIYHGIEDQRIQPTFTSEIAKSVILQIRNKAIGFYHVSGEYPNGFTTPFSFAYAIADALNLDKSLVLPVKFKEFSQNRTARPQHTWLSKERIKVLGMNFQSFENILNQFRDQTRKNSN